MLSKRLRSEREARLEQANQVIRIVGSYGRRFLSMNSDRQELSSDPRFSHFQFVSGRLFYIDKHTQKRIWVHTELAWRCGRWRGFSDGGTLQDLIKSLRDFILTGDRSFLRRFGPWPEWVCQGDLWGYGDDITKVRQDISALMGESCPPSLTEVRT